MLQICRRCHYSKPPRGKPSFCRLSVRAAKRSHHIRFRLHRLREIEFDSCGSPGAMLEIGPVRPAPFTCAQSGETDFSCPAAPARSNGLAGRASTWCAMSSQPDPADQKWLRWLHRFFVVDVVRDTYDLPVGRYPEIIAAARQRMTEAGIGDDLIAVFEAELSEAFRLSLTSEEEATMNWTDEIKKRFPLLGTPDGLANWPSLRAKLKTGEAVSGIVVARTLTSVWLDIGISVPAYLPAAFMKDPRRRRSQVSAYPAVSERVDCWICSAGERETILVTQRESDLSRIPLELPVPTAPTRPVPGHFLTSVPFRNRPE